MSWLSDVFSQKINWSKKSTFDHQIKSNQRFASLDPLFINYWYPIRLVWPDYWTTSNYWYPSDYCAQNILNILKLSFLPSLNVSKTENVSFFNDTLIINYWDPIQLLCTEYLKYLKAFFSYLLWMCPRLKMFHLKLLAWVDLRNPLQFHRQCRR